MTRVVDLAALAAWFGARLRAHGLPVGPQRCARFASAVQLVQPSTVAELHWCAQATLVADPADIPVLERVFAAVFGGAERAVGQSGRRSGVVAALPDPTGFAGDEPYDERDESDESDDRARPSWAMLATHAERLRHRDFATLTPVELAQLVTVMQQLRLATPVRRSRRDRLGPRGRHIDIRTTLRRAQRHGGYPIVLARHKRPLRHRRLVVLCDISGSMEPYARALLQLLYCASATVGHAEVFTFATRLTRLTRALVRVRPEAALAKAGQAAPDWSGGTRIGEALKAFLDRYGARGMARGAVVLIISDGWETGDAELLGAQMARLSRLAYRIVWANPRTASEGYQPLVAGMAAAWPWCDAVVSAHSLDALGDLLAALAALPGRR
jgi:uncharacterized protein